MLAFLQKIILILILKQTPFKTFKIIEKDFNYKFKKIIKPSQTHSSNVSIVDEKNINSTFDNTDGLITNIKEVALVASLTDS